VTSGVKDTPGVVAPSRLVALVSSRSSVAARSLTLVVLAAAVLAPLVAHGGFTLGILTDSLVYVVLALSYDLSVGRVGALSLAHPAFFGTGAYAAAITWQRYSFSLPLQVLVAVGAAMVLAVLIGIPAFRLSHLTFGMATLGFDQAAQQYYVFLLVAVLVAAFVWILVRSRIGRAYVAIREDEPMAMSVGIDPKRYRMSAFVVGAALAGLLGAFYAHYLSVVCPTNLDISYTINLLVILFLGGTGGFWGIIAAAFVFTAIPEELQVAPNVRLIVYGAALLLGISLLPEGFEGAVRQAGRRMTRRSRARSA
jgi:ABC-type branched-subunit amino acid transport system permease subunit